MKRSISDMLNEVSVENWEIRGKNPLSTGRIKNRTMDAIGESTHKKVRWVPKVALIAAILVSMLVTAFAAETIISESVSKRKMGGYFGETLSDKQVEQMEDIGKTFGESMTCKGTTITVMEAIADENVMYVYLRVEAKEGVVLPDLGDDQHYSISEIRGNDPLMKAWSIPSKEWVFMHVDHSMTSLPDEDPTDNIKEFVLRLGKNGNFTIFNGPWQKVLMIQGLYIRNNIGMEQETLFRGCFEFDVTINDENRDDSKLVIEVDNAQYHDKQYGFVTTVSKVTITPLRIDIEFKFTESNDRYIHPSGGPVELVMKDGTVIMAMDAYMDARESGYHPDSIVGSSGRNRFDEPIVVEDIDYVRIGDDYIVDVN